MQMVPIDESKKEIVNDVKTVENNAVDNWWPITELPSKFKIYPEGTKLFGRPLKVLDVKLLSSIDENNANFIINDVIKRNIKGIKIEDMLIADKLFLTFWLRANTFKDSGYEIKFECSVCNKESTYNFALDCLDIKYIKDNYSLDKEIELPISKKKIKTRLALVKDEKVTDNFIKSEKDTNIKYDNDVLVVSNLITSIDGNITLTLKEKYNQLIEWEPADYSYLESYLLQSDFGVVPVLKVKCNNKECGGSSLIEVSFRNNFFVPYYRFE